MLRPFLAAWEAYSRRVELRITGLVFGLLLLVALATRFDQPGIGFWPTTPVLITCGMLMLQFAAVIKELYTTPLARMVPHFSRAHLAAAGTLWAVVWLLTSMILAGVTAATFLGIGSILLALLVLIAWGTCLQPFVLFISFAAAFSASLSSTGRAWFVSLMLGESPRLCGLIVAGAALAAGALGAKLRSLTEDQRAFRRWFSSRPGWGEVRSGRLENEEAAKLPWHRIRGRQLESLLSKPVAGLWWESRRLRLAAGYPPMAIVLLILMMALFLMVHLGNRGQTARDPSSLLAMYLICSWGLFAYTRRAWMRLICQELARPVRRERLLAQIAVAWCRDLLELVILLSLFSFLADRPHVLLHVLAMACLSPLLLGLGGLLLFVPSEIGAALLGSLSMMPVGLFLVVLYKVGLAVSIPAALGVGGVAVLAGLVLCYVVYRVWLEHEFG